MNTITEDRENLARNTGGSTMNTTYETLEQVIRRDRDKAASMGEFDHDAPFESAEGRAYSQGKADAYRHVLGLIAERTVGASEVRER